MNNSANVCIYRIPMIPTLAIQILMKLSNWILKKRSERWLW